MEKELQAKQDAEFEKLNPEFCGQVWGGQCVCARPAPSPWIEVASCVCELRSAVPHPPPAPSTCLAQFKKDLETRQANDAKRAADALST
jgi:hypothetical protein